MTFRFRETQFGNENDFDLEDELSGANLQDEAKLSMLFRVQNHSDVVAFKCQNLVKIENHHKIRSFEDAMELTLAKVSEHCRNQNKVFEKINKATE